MKLARSSLVVGIVACLAITAGNADAARLYFSTSSTSPTERVNSTTGVNPTINLTVGQTTSVYIWAELVESTTEDPDNPGTFFYEQFAGLGLDLGRDNSGVTLATGTLGAAIANPDFVVDNPSTFGIARWGSVAKGTFGGSFIFDNANFVKTGGSFYGQPGTAGYVVAKNSARLGRLDLVASAAGTTTFRFGVGSSGIAFQNQVAGYPINFGWSDTAIAGNSFGTQSTLADITFNVVPEPGTFALLGLGLVGLVAVARKRRSA